MTQTPPPKRTTGAIQKAVQVRKTQEMLQQQEERRRNERLTPEERKALDELRNPQQPAAKAPSNTGTPPARSTQVHAAVSTGTVPAIRQTLTDAVLERIGWTRTQLQIGIGALLGILLLCGAASLLSLLISPSSPPATPTPIPLPSIAVSDLQDQFKQLGFTLTSVQPLTVPSTNWQATQGVRFDAAQGKDKGTFLLLSYPSADKAAQDSFRANLSDTWKKWKRRQYNTLLIIAAPETPDTMMNTIDGAIFTKYIAPYRSWLPTLTPAPNK